MEIGPLSTSTTLATATLVVALATLADAGNSQRAVMSDGCETAAARLHAKGAVSSTGASIESKRHRPDRLWTTAERAIRRMNPVSSGVRSRQGRHAEREADDATRWPP